MNQSVQPAEAVRPAETVTEGRPQTRTPDPVMSDGGASAGLNGIPRQSARRSRVAQTPVPRTPVPRTPVPRTPVPEPLVPERRAVVPRGGRSAAAARSSATGSPAAGGAAPGRIARLRPWRLLPTPTRTPFTFGYALVLAVTSVVAAYADPGLVSALLRGSSTDVAHLSHTPVLVLLASALWVAGGITSPYAIGFLLVLTALERRIGGLRTAGVFLLGHVVATLVTEVPVGLSVLAGHLPDSSLHRLDYGISFGVAASVGALAGLLTPWLRWVVLGGFGCMLIEDLIAFTDPMTNWGHLLALVIGVSTWPLLRRRDPRAAPRPSGGGPATS
ncbi:rhomboid-like protein [Streptomyces sp. NPDC005562]|uniref:rhomboid-like protein n=1 Tax=Streptomyces sp. NPDC005562 TaxID=3154890 RepID=UPI0033A550E1